MNNNEPFILILYLDEN